MRADEHKLDGHLLAAMTNAAYEALLVLDEERRVVAFNQAAQELFGAAAQVGAPLAAVVGSPEIDGMVLYALENGEDVFEVQTTIGSRFFRIRTFVERSSVPLIGLALQDVTELVRLNRARRDMVANISHELRTPIATIRLIIDGLFSDEDKPKRKRSIQSLRAIAKEADSLQWLVQELMDLSMIESGQAIVRMVTTPLLPLVQDSIERVQDQAEAKGIDITVLVEERLAVLCDPDLIRRVLVNLVHNAIKWTPASGTITVAAQDEGEYVLIRVQDSGPGVPDDQTERVFERFYQVDASRSGQEGTGLGLSICRHIIEAHGGTIWAVGNSSSGGGVFQFRLLSSETSGDTH